MNPGPTETLPWLVEQWLRCGTAMHHALHGENLGDHCDRMKSHGTKFQF